MKLHEAKSIILDLLVEAENLVNLYDEKRYSAVLKANKIKIIKMVSF